ncbi:hypothetical protein LI014_06275 [Clostridium perfringens]|uniref:hypothetical protein n=1 Tax=Clostridium perfringens TaxID=1502 RepID=UPI002245A6BA|nr:hypothetical protein [Clostridium perfringens]MCX0396978.1 hypothetical protein [Clostridium perfringens]
MEGVKISQLLKTDHINDSDSFIILQEGETKRVEGMILQNLKTSVVNNVIDGGLDKALSAEQGRLLAKRLADLEYKPISILSFNNNNSVVEMGNVIHGVKLTWNLNKQPILQTVNKENIDVKLREFDLIKDINKDITISLEVKDDRGLIVNKTTSVNFMNGVYYGVSNKDISTSEDILTLKKELSNSKARSVSVNCGQDQYIYYCLPSRLGNCIFFVGGFEGGFTKIKTIQFKNSFGYIENYDIYKSTNKNLGNTTITIK